MLRVTKQVQKVMLLICFASPKYNEQTHTHADQLILCVYPDPYKNIHSNPVTETSDRVEITLLQKHQTIF